MAFFLIPYRNRMLLRTPEMLRKSGINEGNAMNYLAFIVKSSTIFVLEKQSAVKPRDSWRTTQRSLPLAYRLPCTPNLKIFILFKIQFYIFSYVYYSLFRDVPECSGMFRDVPCSPPYDRPPRDHKSFKLWPVICITLYLHILLSVSVDLQFPFRALSSITKRN